MVGVLAGVVLGGEAASQKFSSVGSVIDPTGFDAGTSDGGSASVDTTSSSSSTSTSTTSTTTVSSRSGSLFSNEAILRSSPNLGATEIRRFVDRNGMGLTVIGSIDQSGWYQVSIDGTEGYLFGAFVTPPEPGYCVAESRGTEPDIIDSSGFVVVPAGGNPSGSKVLVTTENPGGSSWPVVLADGRTGFVRASDMKSPLC